MVAISRAMDDDEEEDDADNDDDSDDVTHLAKRIYTYALKPKPQTLQYLSLSLSYASHRPYMCYLSHLFAVYGWVGKVPLPTCHHMLIWAIWAVPIYRLTSRRMPIQMMIQRIHLLRVGMQLGETGLSEKS